MLASVLCSWEASAQQAPEPAAAPAQQQGPQMPDEYRLNLMIRSMIVALHQANITGNYSVLRELGTPSFQISNTSAKLAEIFAPLRARKLDLSPTIFFNPKLVAPAAVQDGQMLRLTGFFPTTPENVNFDLAFQVFGDQWMLAGISISSSPADPQRSAQIASLPSPPPNGPRSASNASAAAEAKAAPGEAKPIRIDLSEPAPLPVKRPAVIHRKPKPPAPPAQPAAQPGGQQQKPAAANEQDENANRSKSSNVTQGWRPE